MQSIWKLLNIDLTYGHHIIFYSKLKLGQIGPESRTASELLENLYESPFKYVKFESDTNILLFMLGFGWGDRGWVS